MLLAAAFLLPGGVGLARSDSTATPRAITILRGLDEYGLRRAYLKFSVRDWVSSLTGGGSYAPATSTLSFAFPIRRDSSIALAGWKYTDRVEQNFARRNLGTGPVLDIGALFRPKRPAPRPLAKRRASTLPMPTPREAAVLAELWKHGSRTSLDLYASLDSSLLAGVTAETFWRELHRMARRGFVEERIVSPQNLLLVGFGPFAIPVELSAKNRRNRIWLYRPLADRRDLIDYLEARRYLAATDPASRAYLHDLDSLEELLEILRGLRSERAERP